MSLLIPLAATILLLAYAARPFGASQGDYAAMDVLARFIWLVPVSLIWAAYFGLAWFFQW